MEPCMPKTRYTWLVCCWCSVMACLCIRVMGEIPFHERDHSDQRRDFQVHYTVQTVEDVVGYLNKYGYLKHCAQPVNRKQVRPPRYNRLSLFFGKRKKEQPEPIVEDVRTKPVCTWAQINESISAFQKRFNLTKTGIVDESTLAFMQKSRCGNADNEKGVVVGESTKSTTTMIETTDTVSSSTTDTVSSSTTETVSSSKTYTDTSFVTESTMAYNVPETTTIATVDVEIETRNDTSGNETHYETVGNQTYNYTRDDENGQNILHTRHKRSASEPNMDKMGSQNREDTLRLSQSHNSEDSVLHRLLRPAKYIPGSGWARRQIMLQEYIDRIRTRPVELQRSRTTIQNTQKRPHRIVKRSVVTAVHDDSFKFNKKHITWRLVDIGYSTQIPANTQLAVLHLAFRMWSEVTPITFTEDTTSDILDVDIEIAFAKLNHMNCEKVFDGTGGELAHSWTAGDIHFDDEEFYTADGDMGINFLKVAVHEIGHVLSLAHTERQYSVMYAIYTSTQVYNDFELGWEDRKAVQEVYGECKGRFTAVYDRLYKKKGTQNQVVYNTYFFRDGYYWMYENRANRTRYGDPLLVRNEWKGLPQTIDAVTQVFLWQDDSGTWDFATIFFKGEYYYKYDDVEDRVAEGYPKTIRSEFGPKAGWNESIPDNLDAVFWDQRDLLLYFFKDEWVWIYNPLEVQDQGCCEKKMAFTELFPTDPEEPEPVNGYIDTVYVSNADDAMYFFKGEDVYKNTWYRKLYNLPAASKLNRLKKSNKWFKQWYDICDVEPEKISR